MKNRILYYGLSLLSLMFVGFGMSSCKDDIDNLASKNMSEIQISPSTDYIKLDEANPDATALTIDWTSAHDFGYDFITTYKYEIQCIGSTVENIEEYEDDGVFHRSYTNKELQEMLVDRFGMLTSTLNEVIVTVTASFEGNKLIVPDIATAHIKIKTYGEKQFAADKMYLSGSAVGDDDVEMKVSDSDNMIYTYTGKLSAGTVNFPVVNFDEMNAIGPDASDVAISENDMEAVVTDRNEANFWVIPEEDTYKVTVNLRNHTVRIISAGSLIALDALYLAGSAVPEGNVEVAQTLENENVYAWKGELKAGSLYLPILIDEATDMSIAPKTGGVVGMDDGNGMLFTQVSTGTASGGRYWSIPANGTYRVVVDLDSKTLTIYSEATDKSNMTVSYNNTVAGINPFSQEVTELWMWGGYNSSAHDADLKAGFQSKYKLVQSLANPYVFVYKGDKLPRESVVDGNNQTGDNKGKAIQGYVKFLVSSIENNVYAYGSTASAVRNSYSGYISPTLGQTETIVGGQSNNRYAYFIIPEGCNYVCVDIEKMTVVFDQK